MLLRGVCWLNRHRGDFALSMKLAERDASHFQIVKNADGKYVFGGTKHASLLDLEVFLLTNQKSATVQMRKRFE